MVGRWLFMDGYITILKEVKKGDFFRLSESGQVYIKGDYIRSDKKYECYKFYDCNSFSYIKGTRKVYSGFTF